jgi:hypothetical protein
MPKTKISQYDSTSAGANLNTDIAGINIDEGCAPSGINNAIRTLMAQIRDLQSGVSGDSIPVTAGGTGSTTASGARTNLSAAASGANSDITSLTACTSITGLTTPLTVAQGGTGAATLTTAYGVLAAGTTATGSLQNIGTGTSAQVLTSNGAGALPTFQTISVSSDGLKNRIINGDMRIDQRNAGASVTPSNSYTLDRWSARTSQASKFSVQQVSANANTSQGFDQSLIVTSLSAYSIISSDTFGIRQRIEGYNIADLGWGTANAKTVTLSFWVYSSLTGTFGGAIQNSAGNRSYPFSYTISSANTWEQKTITIAGDTTGTWLTNNGIGLELFFGLGVGSTLSGTAGSWAAADYNSATGATSVVGTNGATFYITGVQLEVGSTATQFERRLYGQELINCQRYFWMIATGNNKSIGSGYNYTTTNMQMTIQHPVTMRTVPTLYQATGTGYYTFERNGTGDAFNSLTLGSTTTDTVSLPFNSTEISGTAGQAGNVYLSNASAYVGLSAEL